MSEQQTRTELFKEEAQLFAVQQRLNQYQNVNWQALAQQDVQKYAAAQAEYTQLRDYADRLSGHVEGRKAELARAAEQETAIALSKAVEALNKPNPALGWDGKFDADKRASLTKFGIELGFTNEELSNTSHPLMIQTLNLARIGYETLRKQNASLKTRSGSSGANARSQGSAAPDNPNIAPSRRRRVPQKDNVDGKHHSDANRSDPRGAADSPLQTEVHRHHQSAVR